MAKSEQEVNDGSELKCWSDLLLTHNWVFEKGKSFLLLCAKNFQHITEKDFQNVVDDTLSDGFQTVKITDGFLIEDLTSEQKRFLLEKLDSQYHTCWKLVKKRVPPIHPRGFVIQSQGPGNIKQTDLKKHLVKFERKSGKRMDFVNSPTVTATKEKFIVMYDREVDIEFLKAEIENEKFKDNFLRVESLFESDCVRLENLSTSVTDFDILEEFEKIGDCQITFIKRSGNKVAFVYLGHYNDPPIIVKGLQKSKAMKVFGNGAKFSLFYQASSFPLQQTNPQGKTQNKGSKSAIVRTKLDKNDRSEPNAHSSAEKMEIEYSNTGAMDYQQPSSSKTKSGASNDSFTDSNQIIRFEFKPSVPYDVMEFVHLSPEVFDALSKKFNKVKVELTKKQANTVHGFSMFYVVTFTLPQNKEMREKYRQGMLEFEQNCIKWVQDFLSQLSTKTESFDFTKITAMRSEMGWDQDDADLIVVQNDSQEMVQAFVRWDDIIKGDVTVSGYRNQIDDIFKILKKSAALQAQSRASTSSRIRHQHHQGEIPSSSHQREIPSSSHQREIPSSSHQREIPTSNHQHHSYAFAASQKFQKPGQNGKLVQLNPGLIPWFIKFSKTEYGHLFKEVEMSVTDGGVILIGESSAATRAQHWVSEIAPQLVTDHQKLENDDDLEFLTCDSGKKFLEEVESKTKCSVFVQTKTGQSLSMTHQPQVLMERKLVDSDVIVRVIKVDITEHHCDAIVNASNETLRLISAGVSGSISKKGGMEIQKEMDQIRVNRGRLQPGEAVSTSAGNGSLPCKRIIHAVGPRWGMATIGTSVRHLQSCISQSLLQTEVDGSTSIAFPAISCGVFGGKPEMCAGIIVRAITQYFMEHNYSKIRRIDLVEISDDWVLAQFKMALEPLSTPLKTGTKSTSLYSTAGQAITTQPKTKQTPLPATGIMNVTVKQGDITTEASDAIVNPSSSSFDFDGQVGQIILSKGGKDIKKECHSVRKLFDWDLRVTSGGRLPAKNIMHIAMPSDSSRLTPLLVRVFEKAESLKLRSIALPAVGTGTLRGDVRFCAQILRSAIDTFESKHPKHLKDIRAVIWDERIIGTYRSALLQGRRPVAQPVAEDSSVDPVKLPSVDVGYGKPGLFFCASESSEIREAQSMVAHYIKEQSLKSKTYTEKVNLTKEEETYWRDRIFDVEDRFKVTIELNITRSGRNAKFSGERDNVKKAMSSLQRDFHHYRQEIDRRSHYRQTNPIPRSSSISDEDNARAPKQPKKDRERNDEIDRRFQGASTSNRGDAGKERDADKIENVGNRTEEPDSHKFSNRNNGQQADRDPSRDYPVPSDVHDKESDRSKTLPPNVGARGRRKLAQKKEKSGEFTDEQGTDGDNHASNTDHGVVGGITDDQSVSKEKNTAVIDTGGGKSKSRREASTEKSTDEDSTFVSRLASNSSLPDSPEAQRKTVKPHVTASASSGDKRKAGHRKLNEKQKTTPSHENERSGSDDSDDQFEDARSDFSDSETPGHASTTEKSPMVQEMSHTKAENVNQVHKNELKIKRQSSESGGVGDESDVKVESGKPVENDSQMKRPKPAPRKILPSSGASLSRSTSMENSEQEAKEKSEQETKEKSEQRAKGKSEQIVKMSEQDEQEKLEQEKKGKSENTVKKSDQRTVGTLDQDDQEKLGQERKGKSEHMAKKSKQQTIGTSEQDREEKSEPETKEETEPRAKKSEQPLGEDPLHGVSEKKLGKSDEREDLGSPAEETTPGANNESEKSENRKSGKQDTEQSSQLGAEENKEQEIEEKSKQREMKTTEQKRKDTPGKKQRKKSDQSDKEEPKAEPMQKQDTEVEQEVTGNKAGFTFYNLTGKSSQFEMKEWEEAWRNLETNEWLLLDVPKTETKFQKVVDRLGVKPGFKLPKIIQQVKNPTLYQKFSAERQKTALTKKPYYFYPIVEEDLLENICGFGWNSSANQSDTSDDDDDDEGAIFFHRFKQAMTYARPDHNGSRQVIMADVLPDNISELASATLTITKNERAYPIYVLTFA